MLLRPKNSKFRKAQKGRLQSKAKPICSLELGNYGIVALESFRLRATHLESCRLAVRRIIKRNGDIFFRVFPHTPVTKKPQEVRMGKGKGSVDHFISRIRPNTMILEIRFKGEPLVGLKALEVACKILPVKTKILTGESPLNIVYDN
jgi:large subunit ribosomal protein L16